MKRTLILAACASLLTTAAFAATQDADVEAAAMAKCMADTAALGAEDAEAGCSCFVEALPEDELAAYAEISDWESEATDAMKEAGAACFPELN